MVDADTKTTRDPGMHDDDERVETDACSPGVFSFHEWIFRIDHVCHRRVLHIIMRSRILVYIIIYCT